MPWVGVGYMTLQQQITVTGPGGVSLYRVLCTCGCGAKLEFLLPYDRREQELAVAMGQVAEHWVKHFGKS